MYARNIRLNLFYEYYNKKKLSSPIEKNRLMSNITIFLFFIFVGIS